MRSEKTVFLIPNAPFEPFGVNFSDPGANYNMKRITIAPGYRSACIKASGDDIRTLGWSQVGSSAVYQTSLTAATHNIHHVLKIDQFNAYNQPVSLPYYGDLGSLQNDGRGFFFDNAARKLYVADGGSSIMANRASYMALFGGTIQLNGARLIIDGNISIDGLEFLAKEEGGQPPIICLSGTRHRFSPGHSIHTEGGIFLSEGVTTYAGAYDGWNYDIGSSGRKAFAMEIGCHGYGAGDLETYGAVGQQNRNGSSAHGGADVIRYGGRYRGNYGPNVNDTGLAGCSSASWNVGCSTGQSHSDIFNQGFASFSVENGPRNVWIDTCLDDDASGAGVLADQPDNTVKIYNVVTNGAPPQALHCATLSLYTPDAP